MANIKCNGKIEAQTMKTQGIEVQGAFSALTNIGNGFEISDSTNVGIELGRRDGTAGTPYIDFHTDGKSSTDYNSRIMATGSKIAVSASGGLTLNNKSVDAIEEAGSDYIRYSNGLQICWGNNAPGVDVTDYQDGIISFPREFSSKTSYSVTATLRRESAINYRDTTFSIRNLKNTGFEYQWFGQSYKSDRWQVQWIAIGKWK